MTAGPRLETSRDFFVFLGLCTTVGLLVGGGLLAAGVRFPGSRPEHRPGLREQVEAVALADPPAFAIDPKTGVDRNGTTVSCRRARRYRSWDCTISSGGRTTRGVVGGSWLEPLP